MENRQEEPKKLNPENSSNFIPPRYWVGLEELDEKYWKNPETQAKRGQEFFEKPIEYLEKIEKLDQSGLARRDFLTVMGASMAMASAACARRPVHKIIPYVVKPEEITPGVAYWYASSCQECSNGCGILAKDREGRPIKLEGNPDHPVNQGTLCARGQASLLNLYDTDRLRNPLVRSRLGGTPKEVSWNEIDSTIQEKLKSIRSSSGRVRILSGATHSPSTQRIGEEFLKLFKNGKWVNYDPLQLGEISEAQQLSYGTPVTPHYYFESANVILSLGADFLGEWLSPLEYARNWVKGRKLTGNHPTQEKLTKLITFEPNFSITGANSDERYSVRPGDELKIALALAYEVIIHQKKSNFAQDANVLKRLSGYSPEQVANEIGIPGGALALKKIANILWENRGKSLVIGGSIGSKTETALPLQIAINFLNTVFENEGKTVDGVVNVASPQGNFSDLTQLISEMHSGQVDALIIYQSNPAYTLPREVLKWDEAIKKVPLVIAFSDREDETAQGADYILPVPHYLENWGDSNPRRGVYGIQQPTLAPLHSTRSFQDSLITWVKGSQFVTNELVGRSKDWHDFLKKNWNETLYKNSNSPAPFEKFWESVLRAGFFNLRLSQKPIARNFRIDSLGQLPNYQPVDQNTVFLALYPTLSIYDGRSANNAWLQEMPHPLSSVTWDNYLNISPTLSKKMGFKNDDVVKVTVGDFSLELPIYIQPGMHANAVSIAIGYGRRAVGKIGNQTGVDVYPLLKVKQNRLIFSGQAVTQLKKTGKFYQLATTQWHTVTEERPIINDITWQEYQKNPATANHTDPHLRLETVPTIWPKHEYKGYRWGMAIDLNSCIGCSACVIACQVENNVPVVGRSQVRVSRQMHWLRIDRYYSGTPENPDVVFQPMLCQHCENAPCETVCPVLATVHDDEALNVQVYNRCVGTRYCQNNCPYKVRRFNFFDHWKSYDGTMNLVWNPEVTVRSRGIMEKCTFCLQRISAGKDKAKDAGERVRDGEIRTACQQTCPTDAIVFGDTNDPNSRVTKLRENARAFRSLEILNARPMISYLTKVRNKQPNEHAGAGAEHA